MNKISPQPSNGFTSCELKRESRPVYDEGYEINILRQPLEPCSPDFIDGFTLDPNLKVKELFQQEETIFKRNSASLENNEPSKRQKNKKSHISLGKVGVYSREHHPGTFFSKSTQTEGNLTLLFAGDRCSIKLVKAPANTTP